MEISSKIRPVDAYNQKIISTAVASKPLERPSLRINSDLQGIEQTRQVKAYTDQKIAVGIKNFLVLHDVRLEFSIDKNTGEIMLRIINNPSGRIVREIPGMVLFGGINTIEETV
jgi:uncharacterized FlaG/YvyC family protein